MILWIVLYSTVKKSYIIASSKMGKKIIRIHKEVEVLDLAGIYAYIARDNPEAGK